MLPAVLGCITFVGTFLTVHVKTVWFIVNIILLIPLFDKHDVMIGPLPTFLPVKSIQQNPESTLQPYLAVYMVIWST